jgi:rare lipoprotein A
MSFQNFVFLTQILLLFVAPLNAAHARASTTLPAEAASKPLTPSVGFAARKKTKSKTAHGQKKAAAKGLSGTAGYYSNRFHGRQTASRRTYDKNGMTAAHRSLPLGTWVRVTHQRNGKNVLVQITDRGPFSGHRLIDLSHAAASDLDMLHSGTAPVRLEVVQEQPSSEVALSNSVQLAAE